VSQATSSQREDPFDDVAVARACAAGDRKAIARVERELFPALALALRRKNIAPDVADDVLASMRVQLFFHDPPLIAQFAGKGRLVSWLRRIVVRAAIKRARRERQTADLDEIDELPSLASDPELAYLSRYFGSAVKLAIGEVLAGLAPDDRDLLRRSLLEGTSIDAIAKLRRVHRATAARRIAGVRQRLVVEVHRTLGARLGLSHDEIATMGSILSHDLELSLARQLASTRRRAAKS